MERLTIKIISLIVLISLSLSKTVQYSVNFWGFHTADIVATYTDTVFQEQDAVKIHYSTTTTPIASRFFFVENSYTTIIHKNTHTLLSFNKNTQQPELSNSISTYFDNDILYYSNKQQPVDINNPNIFTLFYMLQSGKTKNILDQKFQLEREGLIYSANLIELKKDSVLIYELELKLSESKTDTAVYENTDIFTWAVFKPDAERLITVDTLTNTITHCEFSFGLIRLTANAITIE